MVYQLSATKLQTYHRCPKHNFRYELGLKTAAFFGSAALGTALHQALPGVPRLALPEPIPELDWVHYCWHNSQSLSPAQAQEGTEF